MTVASTAIETLAAMKEERDALAAELEQERRKADCGAGGIEPCRISPACKTCQIVEVMSHRLAISAELQTARNAIEALGRQLREARERFADLDAEMQRARKKFPRNRRLLTALVEEVGELAKALLQRDPNWRTEALQVACVAMRIREEGDADFDDVTDEEAQK